MARTRRSSNTVKVEMQDPTTYTRYQRIKLHLRCPWRNWREARFHIAGIVREFEPR